MRRGVIPGAAGRSSDRRRPSGGAVL